MEHLDTIVIAAIFFTFGIFELIGGLYLNSKKRKDDWIIDIISIAQFAVLIKPAIILIVGILSSYFIPQFENYLNLPLWLAVILIILPDEFLHYWYHRKGHEWHWLWKIHRTHHTTPDMGVGISFRENWLWFVLMPNLWFSAIWIYLGLGEAYIISNMIIGGVDILTHTKVKWDKKLYAIKALKPFVWLLQRIIILPATHYGHHGYGKNGVPMGNYSTLIAFWDVIFGTAKFTNDYPEHYGIEPDLKDPWYAQLWWPIIKSDKLNSEIGKSTEK